MRTIQLERNGEMIGIVEVSNNNVEARGFSDKSLESTFNELDGMTGYVSEEPTEQDTDHIDRIVPMQEEQVVANVKMVAAVNSLTLTDA